MKRAAAESDPSVSTDLRSDVSFMNRQMELRRLYREFRSAIDTISTVADAGDRSEEEDDASEAGDGTDGDVELVLQEIDLMQSETEEIAAILSKPRFRGNARVQRIRKQLLHLHGVNANLRARAEVLADVE